MLVTVVHAILFSCAISLINLNFNRFSTTDSFTKCEIKQPFLVRLVFAIKLELQSLQRNLCFFYIQSTWKTIYLVNLDLNFLTTIFYNAIVLINTTALWANLRSISDYTFIYQIIYTFY